MSALSSPPRHKSRVVALCGGVGGAKLALGLSRLIGAGLTVVVNTGDDFEHLGFHISPDVDTLIYTLAGLADPQRGWGRADESWNFMQALGRLGGETWFQLGDRDLAMHVERMLALRAGNSLSAFTATMARRLGIASAVLPMSDDRVETVVVTPDGRLGFQHYFVAHQCLPRVYRLEFQHSATASPSEAALAALRTPDLGTIVICPSNPYLSVDPILAVPGYRATLEAATVPIVAVSPLIGGQAVKGPTAKIMAELGIAADSAAIARHYPFLDGLVIDEADRADVERVTIPVHVTATLMRSLEDRDRLAAECLDFAGRLARRPKGSR